MGKSDMEALWWQELREWVLNYLICQGCGCCSLAAFPNLELRRHRGKVVVIVRGTIPCWICHEAKIHHSTSRDVILNVIFNWKINKKWHCPQLQIKRIITAVSSTVWCRNCYSSNCPNGFWAMRSFSFAPTWVSVPEVSTVLSLKGDKWNYMTSALAVWQLMIDSYWYRRVVVVFQLSHMPW